MFENWLTDLEDGFDGGNKVFLLEFSMPKDDTAGFNADMPAIWMLNPQIPRTVQYGNGDCSCWKTGCGEFDVAETLSSGSMFMKSTFRTFALFLSLLKFTYLTM